MLRLRYGGIVSVSVKWSALHIATALCLRLVEPRSYEVFRMALPRPRFLESLWTEFRSIYRKGVEELLADHSVRSGASAVAVRASVADLAPVSVKHR